MVGYGACMGHARALAYMAKLARPSPGSGTMSMPMQPSRGANTGRLDARVSYSIRDRVSATVREQ